MCGITGIWNFSKEAIDPKEFDLFTDSLAHRGPDGRGTYVDESSSLALGHRRLAILDTSPRGHQPMQYAGRRFWITFNGEIYNFLELREQLRKKGHSFKSDSDTEVILAAYTQWGKDCQLKFNGMWAFAIWDSQKRELFLSRDRFGVKPLYYYASTERFVFASEIKAFAALKSFGLSYDPRAVACALEFPQEREACESSLLTGVKQILPGHCLTIESNRQVKIERWWNTLDHLPRVSSNFKKQTEELQQLFYDACKIRMRSDVPLGSALSGGLDSSSVVCAMAEIGNGANQENSRLAKDWQKCFVAKFSDQEQDESAFAQEVIDYSGVIGHFETINSADSIQFLDEIIYANEGIEQLFGSVWLLYRSLRNSGIVISMDGHGGDELFAGYLRRYRDLLNATPVTTKFLKPYSKATGIAFRLLNSVRNPKVAWWQEPNTILRIPGSSKISKWNFVRPYEDMLGPFKEDLQRISHFSHLDKQLYIDFHIGTLPKILRNFDRLSMAHGVEIRAPFLDWRLVTYAFCLPETHKYHNGTTKFILREMMKNRMPDNVRLRKTKLGFEDPWFKWLCGPLKSFVLDTTSSADFLSSSIWNGKKIRELATDFYDSNSPLEKKGRIARVWRCCQAHRLMDLFKDTRYKTCSEKYKAISPKNSLKDGTFNASN